MTASYQILIVDDSKTDVFLMREALESAAIEAMIHVVHDGQAATGFSMRQTRMKTPPVPM